MKDKTPKEIEKMKCCADGECCSASPTSEKQQGASRKQWWKITALTVGVLLIVAATAYSLITRHGNASNALLGNSNVSPVSSNTCNSACDTLGISDLNWVKNLDDVLVKNDVVFVVVQENAKSAEAVTKQVNGVAEKIRDQNVRVYNMALDSGNPEFSTTTQRLGISQFPAVLVLAKCGNGAILTGNLDETKLLETYLTVSNPTCPPGSSGGCCSK